MRRLASLSLPIIILFRHKRMLEGFSYEFASLLLVCFEALLVIVAVILFNKALYDEQNANSKDPVISLGCFFVIFLVPGKLPNSFK